MEDIWKEAKNAVKGRIPEHSYRMWIDPIVFEKTTPDGIAVLCPNLIYQKKDRGTLCRADRVRNGSFVE